MVRAGTAAVTTATLVRKVDREMPMLTGGLLTSTGAAWRKVHLKALKASSTNKKKAGKSLVIMLMKKQGRRNLLKKTF